MRNGRRRKRWAVVVGIVMAALALVLGLPIGYVRLRFPPEKAAQGVAGWLAVRLGRPMWFGRASFHLLRGFAIDSVRIGRSGYPPARRGIALDSLYLGRVSFRYDFRALLHRRLRIRALEIVSPQVFLSSWPARGIDASASHPRGAGRPSGSSPPLDIELSKLEVRDAGIQWSINGQDSYTWLHVTGWQLRLSELRFPRSSPGWPPIRAELEIAMRRGALEGAWKGTRAPIRFAAPLQLSLSSRLDSSRSGGFEFRMNLEELGVRYPAGEAERFVSVPDPLALSIDGEFSVADSATWLRARRVRCNLSKAIPLVGEFEASPGSWHLRLRSDEWKLAAVVELLSQWIPSLGEQVKPSELRKTRVQVGLVDVRARGDTLMGTLQVEMASPRFRLLNPSVQLDSASLMFQTDLTVRAGRFLGGESSLTGIVEACSLCTGAKPGQFRQITLDAGCALDSTFWPRTAHLHFEIRQAFGALAYVETNWTTPKEGRSLRGYATAEVQHLRLNTLFDLAARGRLDFWARAEALGDGTLSLRSSWAVDSLLIPNPIEPVLLAPRRGDLEGRGSFDPERGKVELQEWRLRVADELAARGTAVFSPEGYRLRVDSARARLGSIYEWLKPLLSSTAQQVDLGGDIGLSCSVSAGGGATRLEGELEVSGGLFSRRDVGFASGGMEFRGRFSGDGKQIRLRGEGVADSLWIEELGRRPIQGTRVQGAIRFDLPARMVLLDTLVGSNPQLSLRAIGRGFVDMADPVRLKSVITYSGYASPGGFAQLGDYFALRGPVEYAGGVELDGIYLRFHGNVGLRSNDLRLQGGVILDSLQGNVSYDYVVDRSGRELVYLPMDHLADGYLAAKDDFLWLPPSELSFDTLRVGAIRVGDLRLDELRVALCCRGGIVLAPFFQVFAYGGSIGGKAVYDMRGATSRNGYVEAHVQLGRLSSAALRKEPPDRASLLSGTISLRGRGVTPQDILRYEGWVDFSRIGRDVADDLLRWLDPLGTQRGIQSVRRLLGMGFRPTRVRLELRDGYLYPRIDLKQPWYSPIRLSGSRIRMDRIPMEVLLEPLSPLARK